MRLLFATLTLFSLLFTPSPASAAAQPDILDAAMQRGTLRVGFSTFVPWAMQDKNGNFIGFEIDVATRLAQDFGLKVEFIPTKWSGIIPALLTGQFDIIVAGMTITPERQEKADFTIPYDFAGMDLVASKTKAAGFTTLAQFNNPDVILTARTGGSAKAAIEAHLPKATVRYFDEEGQALREVLVGKAHAFVSSAPLPALQAARNPEKLFRPLAEPFTKEPIGFAVKQGNPETVKRLNTWIEENTKNGWLQQRHAYWFEGVDWEKDIK